MLIPWLEAQPGYWAGRAKTRAALSLDAERNGRWAEAIHHANAAAALGRRHDCREPLPGDQVFLTSQVVG